MLNEISVAEVVAASKSKSDACKKLNLPVNGSGFRKLDKMILECGASTSHFDGGKSKRTKYEVVSKECPVCGDSFETLQGQRNEKTTCSHACANSHFRSGTDNPNWKGTQYKTVCFTNHEKECIICGEKLIVEVHHYNGDHENNEPVNLVPLCPTHHQYWHSRYRHLIQDRVDAYVVLSKLRLIK